MRGRAESRLTPLAVPALLALIVPVLNEAHGIVGLLTPLQAWRQAGVEILVVDGGSTDATVAHATGLADQVLSAPPGRAAQMNAGAAASRAQLLLFLHADTTLPATALPVLCQLAAGVAPLWGRFDVRLDSPRALLWLVGTLMNLRSRITGIATGDQAMFVSREMFTACGGFPLIPLMEDLALSAKLRRELAPLALRLRVLTSARRWEQGGVWRTIGLMWGLRLAYFLGAPPNRLAHWYRQVR